MRNVRSYFVYLGLLFILSAPFGAQAQGLCSTVHISEHVFLDQGASKKEFIGYRDQQNSSLLRKFYDSKTKVWARVEQLPTKQKRAWEELLAAIEFFDWKHLSPTLLSRFLENRNLDVQFRHLYDKMMERPGLSFSNFLSARDYLRTERPEVSVETLKKIHVHLMQGGVEGIQAAQLGQLRGAIVFGRVIEQNPVSDLGLQNVAGNQFLVPQLRPAPERAVSDLWVRRIWLGREYKPESRFEGGYYGQILYPSVRTLNPILKAELEQLRPDLFGRVVEYIQRNNLNADAGSEFQALNRELMDFLLARRFAQFHSAKAQLGDVAIGKNEVEYIHLVADFVRDLVAIHPFINGNGRTTRLFANYLLTREGLPPMRLADPDLDLYSSPEAWREHVRLSVVNTARLYKDFEYRLQNQLSPYDAALLFYPEIPDYVPVSLKKGEAQVVPGQKVFREVDSAQFAAFLKEIVRSNPEIVQQMAQNRVRVMGQAVELFTEFIQTKTVRYIHNKHGAQDVDLRFVDPDFIQTFGHARALDTHSYRAKIERWYHADELIWRGLSHRNHEPDQNEILDYFRKTSTHLASNRVLNLVRNGEDLTKAMKQDFVAFNQGLLNGQFVKMAMDHHTAGELYADSYGYSTSRKEAVGKAFAMGAMVIGRYGDHKDPDLQKLLRSRINIASMRAIKDVDLSRLRQVAEDFRYRYPRQVEVMGIGGTDPDAVVLVQRISENGDVMETFFRDPENPNQVLIIEGRFVPGETDLNQMKVKERLSLFAAPAEPPPAVGSPALGAIRGVLNWLGLR